MSIGVVSNILQKIKRDDNSKMLYLALQNNKNNKKSYWLNFISFFIPILGIFWIFFYLLKCPKRSISLIKTVIVSLILQFSFLFFCYFFLFDILGNICINLFG